MNVPLPITPPLTPAEQTDLTKAENAIAKHGKAFVAVGQALLVIRDQRLYRMTHATFEAYVKDRWDMGKDYANKTIAASATATALATNVAIPNEAVARAIKPVLDQRGPVVAAELLTKVEQMGPVTAKAVTAMAPGYLLALNSGPISPGAAPAPGLSPALQRGRKEYGRVLMAMSILIAMKEDEVANFINSLPDEQRKAGKDLARNSIGHLNRLRGKVNP